MIASIASLAIIGTAVWLISADPAHKFHHESVQSVAPVKLAQATPRPIVKEGTVSNAEWRKAVAAEMYFVETGVLKDDSK